VFAYPRYGTQTGPGAPGLQVPAGRGQDPNAVANAFKVDPNLENLRNSLSDENGQIWVLNGSGIDHQATNIAAYLDYYGLTASARRPGRIRPASAAPR
jgi:hypothetical protein